MVEFRKRKSDGQSFPVGTAKKIRANNPSNDVGGIKLGSGTKVPNFQGIDLKPTSELDNFSISKTNWNIGFDSDENIDEVGVHDQFAGFSWNAGKDEVGTFLGRIKKSKITEQFVTETEDKPIIFTKFKEQWKKNLGTGKVEVDKNDDGIFALSGDNNEWDQGGNEVESEEGFNDVFENDELDLTEEEKDKVRTKTFETDFGYSYGDYLIEHGEGDRQDILELLNSSENFTDLFDGLSTESFEIQRLENVILGKESAFRITILEAIASLRKEGEISESKS